MKKIIQILGNKDGIIKARLYNDGSVEEVMWDGKSYMTFLTGEKYPQLHWAETVAAPGKESKKRSKRSS